MSRRRHGFTLIEILLVVGAIAILSSVAIVTISNTQQNTRNTKLEADVAAINSAIQVYKVNGGAPLASAGSAQQVPNDILTMLKTQASDATAVTINGLRGSVVDLRLKATTQSDSEASSSQERAVWNGASQRFVLATSGGVGVKEFVFDDSAAAAGPGSQDRTPMLKTGASGWVWNYNDVSPASASTGPTNVPGTAVDPTETSPVAPTRLQLNPPTFSQAGGNVPLVNFDLSITLTNPNPTGASQIYYSTGGGFALYTGQTLTVTPSETVSAFAKSTDPDHWNDSTTIPNLYTPKPVTLSVSLNLPVTTMTYAQAGGAMTIGSTQTPAPATITLNSTSQIPTKYITSSGFQTYYTYGGASPLSSGSAGPSFSNGYTSPSIDLSLGNWGSASSLVVSAAARSLNTAMFTSSSVVTGTVSITPTTLVAPSIDPPSGSKAVDLPVSIATATGQNYPVGARIYYTIDGTDPGSTGGEPIGGTLYTGQFNSGAGTNGVVVVTARVYGPAGYGQWFTPSPTAINTYSTITLADGALVGSATLNGTFNGSLIYAAPSSGTMNSIAFNSGAQIIGGNLYLPGEPTIRLSNGTVWSTANDSLFAGFIEGWEYNASGVKTVQTTPRVLDQTGSITPNNYSVTFNKNSLLEGKVIRRNTAAAFPVIAAPPAPDGNGSISLNTAPGSALSASQYSSITLNSAPVGNVSLNAGHYATLTANNGTSFVLGDPLHPDITQIYSFQNLNLNSGASIQVVGKAIVTVAGTINLSNGSVIGNSAHPEWLQLQFSSGSLNANSGSTIYAQLVDPTGTISFNAGSVFVGSVTAGSLTINSNGVVFDLPPVIQN